MSDDEKVIPAKVGIVGTNGDLLNETPLERKARLTHSKRRDFVTGHELDQVRADMGDVVEKISAGISTAALAVGQKMYDQFSEETAQLLEEMEQTIVDRVMRQVEERSLRGRVRRLWHRLRPPTPKLLVDPAIEAMDPNVAGAGRAHAETEYIPIKADGSPGYDA